MNKEDHLQPILATEGVLTKGVKDQLTGDNSSDDDFWRKNQEPLLLELIATELGIETKDIADFELNLFYMAIFSSP